MDACLYPWLAVGKECYWLRSSEQHPFIWTMFKGSIVAAYDISKRFYYHCALQSIIATKQHIDTFVANSTYRFIDIDTGKPIHIYLYTDGKSPFLADWKAFYAQQYLWDLTADLVFDTFEDALNGLRHIQQHNIATFRQIERTYVEQLIDLTKDK